MITGNFIWAIRIISLLLMLGFIAHLLIMFRGRKSSPFFLPWILYWISYIALYLQFPFVYSEYYFRIIIYYISIIALLNSMFLVIASEFLSSETRKQKVWLKWCIVFSGLIVLRLISRFEIGELVAAYIYFLVLALYTGRYLHAFPNTYLWLIIILYTYAGFDLLNSRIENPSPLFLTVLWAVDVPRKIVLYYTGYAVLLQKSKPNKQRDHLEASDDISESKSLPINSPTYLPPEPSVQIQFTGMWGFLYIMWRYPSGKIVIMFVIAALMASVAFLAANIPTLIDLFRQIRG